LVNFQSSLIYHLLLLKAKCINIQKNRDGELMDPYNNDEKVDEALMKDDEALMIN
jgi:hypothetical protein